jgi:RNA polymerase sigma factor (sigma-70 family)
MIPHRLNPVLRHVRSIGGAALENLADKELLARFGADGDEIAFTVMVRRHGPMILGLCRRLLADHHAAEDAFQATFLLLAKKARWLRHPERLGPWLYGVGRRVALKARAKAISRREVGSVDVPAKTQSHDDELRPALDAAIATLPSRYREPVVLCYLQGLTYAEAADRLRCPSGTVATRLSRARDRLRVLLVRQGVVPSAGVLTSALTPDAMAAVVPDDLLRSTARWAAALVAGSTGTIPIPILNLAREVTQAMILDKLKVLAVVLVLGVAGAGVALSRPAGPDARPDAPPAAKAAPVANPEADVGRPFSFAMLRQKPPAAYRVDSGDLLGVFVEGVLGDRNTQPPIVNLVSMNPNIPSPAIGFPMPVQEDGTILLPLIDPLDVRGKSVTEIRKLISDAYLGRGLVAPGLRVFVAVAKPRTYRVTVITRHPPPSPGRGRGNGNDVTVNVASDPGRTQITALDLPAYENDVLTALARTNGGLPYALNHATIVIDRDSPESPTGTRQIRIPLHSPVGQPASIKPDDVILKNGDVISVEMDPPPPQAPTPN